MDLGLKAGGPTSIADQGCPVGLEVGRGTMEGFSSCLCY